MQHHSIPATRYQDALQQWRPDADPRQYARWRRQVLTASGGWCAHCQEHFPRHRLQAHHRIPWRQLTDETAYDPGNGMALCLVCHAAVEGRRTAGLAAKVARGIRGAHQAQRVTRLSRVFARLDTRRQRRGEMV